MNTDIDDLVLNKPKTFAMITILGIGISFILFIGNSQLNSLHNNPLPLVNKQAQEQCFQDLLDQNIDARGAKGSICRG